MTINYLLLKIKVLCAIYLIINYRLVLLLILERFAMNDVQLLFNFSARVSSLILSRPKMIKNDIIMKIKITINGTLAVLKQFSILLMHVRHQLASMKMAISTMQMPRINDWHVMVRLPLFLRCCR